MADALGRNDVPCAVVNSVQEIFDDAQLVCLGHLANYGRRSVGQPALPQPGFFSDDAQSISPRRAPHLGEHGREILAELGVAEADIQRLITDRVVGDCAQIRCVSRPLKCQRVPQIMT